MSSKRIKVGMRGVFSCDVGGGGGLKRSAVQIENSIGFCVCVHFEKMKVGVRDGFFFLSKDEPACQCKKIRIKLFMVLLKI